MIASWAGNYIGIPFAEHGRTRAGCDCYGLVRLVHAEEFARLLPLHADDYDFGDRYTEGRLLDEGLALIQAERATEPRIGDLVQLRYEGNPSHVGVYVGDGHMLHVAQINAFSSIVRLDSPPFRSRIVAYWRLP